MAYFILHVLQIEAYEIEALKYTAHLNVAPETTAISVS